MEGIKEIIGKTIAAVVIASSNRRPRQQIFLVFDDETSFEFYGDSFTCAAGLDQMGIDRVLRYAKVAMEAEVTNVYLGAGPTNQADNPAEGAFLAGKKRH